MKEIKQYVALVDCYRKNGFAHCPPKEYLYQRQTRGRYRVAAKSREEARDLVQKAVRFGSVSVYCEDGNPKETLPYKTVVKELTDGSLVPAVPATAPASCHK